MGDRKHYELLIDEIEAMLAFVGPVNDSLINIVLPLYDEIQEVMPERLFVETAPLLRECRYLVSRYKVEGTEEAAAILTSISSYTYKVKQMINDYVSATKYESTLNRTYRSRM